MMAVSFSCPNCGKALVQAHPEHRLLGCVCGKAWYVDEGKLQATGYKKDSQAPEPWGIKIGTTGRDVSGSFEVVGRALLCNEDTIFNYWTLLFEDGSTGILSEGYGVYGVLRKVPMPSSLYPAYMTAVGPGARIRTNEERDLYRLTRWDQFPKVQVEGACLWGEMGTSITIIEIFQPEAETAYEFLDFPGFEDWFFKRRSYHVSELNLQNTLPEKAFPEVHCAGCYQKMVLRTWPYTRSVVCPHCSQLNLRDLRTGTLTKAPRLEDSAVVFNLEIGDPVRLDETDFKVVGSARKAEIMSSSNVWSEYTLYHPQAGFAYLSVYAGHWTYVKEWPEPPPVGGDMSGGFEYEDREFEPFNQYHYKVLGAAGEHIYDLRQTKQYACKEYIHPPNTLISEMSNTEQVWFYGTSIKAAAVEAATGHSRTFSKSVGRSYLFRNLVPFQTGRFMLTVVVIAVLMGLVHTLIISSQRNTVVAQMRIDMGTSGKAEINSPPFMLNRKTNLVFKINAPLSNNWLYLEGTLVNRRSGNEIAFSKTLEYYHGVEGGGRWSEGSTEAEPVLNDLDAGSYFLNVQGQTDSSFGAVQLVPVTIIIRQDVPNNWNLWWSLLLFGGVCVVLYQVNQHYEKIRFEGSPFDPFTRE